MNLALITPSISVEIIRVVSKAEIPKFNVFKPGNTSAKQRYMSFIVVKFVLIEKQWSLFSHVCCWAGKGTENNSDVCPGDKDG